MTKPKRPCRDILPMSESDECEDRLRLGRMVCEAVDAVYSARADLEKAISQKHDATPFMVALARVKDAELAAVTAMARHRKEHRC